MSHIHRQNEVDEISESSDDEFSRHHRERHWWHEPTPTGVVVPAVHHGNHQVVGRHQHKPRRERAIHLDVVNNITNRQRMEDVEDIESVEIPSNVGVFHGECAPSPRVRRRHSFHPRLTRDFVDWPWPWPPPYPYDPYWQDPRAYDQSSTNSSTNAITICGFGGRSPSPHHWGRRPHNPPLPVEKDVILAEESLRQSREKEMVQNEINKLALEREEHEKEKEHWKHDAILEQHEKDEKERAKIKELKEQWEDHQAAQKVKDEEEMKKRQKEIEDEIRKRMAKGGYHNREIESTIEAKKEHYCHKHSCPHPCHFCLDVSPVLFSGRRVRRGRCGWEYVRSR